LVYVLSTKQQQIPDDSTTPEEEVVDLIEDPDMSNDDDSENVSIEGDSDTSEDI